MYSNHLQGARYRPPNIPEFANITEKNLRSFTILA